MKGNLKSIFVLSFALVVSVIAISGGTYAYFAASATPNNIVIHDTSYVMDSTLSVTAVRSGNLIPTADNLIMTSLNGSYPCEDQRGYSLCSLYHVTLDNNATAMQLNAYIKTNSGTTFTANHLKYQLLSYENNTYSSASDVKTISVTNNSKNYFTSSNTNINFTLATNGYLDYYLVIWLSNLNSNQLEDVDKVYKGLFVFESVNGGSVTADFST